MRRGLFDRARAKAQHIAALALFGAMIAPSITSSGCSQRGSGRVPDLPAAAPPTLTIFALAELRGQIEPCGCTTDPLGDLARTTELVEQARAAGPVLVVDAGSMLYSRTPVPPHLVAQERLKAELLAKAYTEELQVGAIGIGPADLGLGIEGVRLPRQAANVEPSTGLPIEAPKIIDVGGTKVGVFGVVAPGVLPGLPVKPPGTAAVAAVADLRRRGARLIVALVQAPDRAAAMALVRNVPGVDLAVAGLGTRAPEPHEISIRAYDLDGAWMVIPANRGQVVSRLAVTLRPGGGALVDAVGPDVAEARRHQLAARIESLEAELAAFRKQADADPAFIATKQQELDAAKTEDRALSSSSLQLPAHGSYFTLAQVRIKKQLPCDTKVQAAKTAYNRAAGAANVEAAAGMKPPVPPPGKPGYVGAEACSDCHAAAEEFWKTTRHIDAWETLERDGKQLDYECIVCHVTGWDEPGGATLAVNEALRDVQCETCHGPGSIHVAKMGKDQPRTILRAPADDLCASRCHTPEHSDTFERTAYLRDVVGPGHGQALRETLGKGPTGHELRAAGLARAGKNLGAGCLK